MYKATLKGRIDSHKTLILIAILHTNMTEYKKIKFFPYAYFKKSTSVSSLSLVSAQSAPSISYLNIYVDYRNHSIILLIHA